ncbi:MAG: hypothetical protein IH831_01775 [Planctomycetes bacterium]|nr:hypothetical protein [Planctomycetota bacterium]
MTRHDVGENNGSSRDGNQIPLCRIAGRLSSLRQEDCLQLSYSRAKLSAT